MRILFAGTDEFATKPLEKIAKKFNIIAVLTKTETTNKNRKKILIPVKEKAISLGIKNIFQFEKLGSLEREEIKKLNVDCLVCVSYGKIFGPKFLDLFKYKINLHPSKLPKYRGPSPLEAAILNQDDKIGVCIQELALKMDSGDILKEGELFLTLRENINELKAMASDLGAKLLCETLEELQNGTKIITRVQKEEDASYCKFIEKQDYNINWNEDAKKIDCKIRAFYPNAYTVFRGKKLNLLESDFNNENLDGENGMVYLDKHTGFLIKTGSGTLILKKLKMESKKELSFLDFFNGNKSIISAILGV